MSNGSRRSGACVRCCLVVFAVASALFVSGPALYWKLKRGFGYNGSNSPSSCPPCVCDCPPPLSLQKIAPGLINLSVPDCGKHDSELNTEMEKQFVDLLTEELKLQEVVSEAQNHHMNYTLLEAKRLASQYQKEAEKCNAATETCEEAREHAEASLIREKKVTLMWERRARRLGWQGE
uniref:Apoptosis inhibitor 5 n=1 Tax=Anthurium amnicola TaxID=1678845 RepID=A0A1D1ZBM2_9ARAE